MNDLPPSELGRTKPPTDDNQLEIIEQGCLIESLGRSVTEAAYRGDVGILTAHIADLRVAVLATIAAFRRLTS